MQIKRNPKVSRTPKPKLAINFNRKILDYQTLQALKDTLSIQGAVRGEAISGVIDDLMKLRHLCEEATKLYRKGDNDKALKAIELMNLIL